MLKCLWSYLSVLAQFSGSGRLWLVSVEITSYKTRHRQLEITIVLVCSHTILGFRKKTLIPMQSLPTPHRSFSLSWPHAIHCSLSVFVIALRHFSLFCRNNNCMQWTARCQCLSYFFAGDRKCAPVCIYSVLLFYRLVWCKCFCDRCKFFFFIPILFTIQKHALTPAT